ncbi:phage major capsid protein [Micrococcus luteus]|uniref:phage major capsid protein n=1 Tax=Micrococcus luteus TaxID=1270 RepID=UPI0039170A6A
MAVTTPGGPKGLYPDQTFIAHEVLPDALLFELATIAGAIEGDAPAIRVPYVSADPTVGFVAEGEEIGVVDPELDEVLVRTAKLAHIVRQTNESAAHSDASELLSLSMTRAMTTKANTALFTNPIVRADAKDSTSAVLQPIGLLNSPGLAEGTGDNVHHWVLDPATNALDPIIDVIAAVESNGGTPTHITTDPKTWAAISKMKAATDSHVPLMGAPTAQAQRVLFGLPVIVTPAMAASPGLLITDKNNIIAADSALRLATSDQHFFGSDSLARRATWRIGWTMVHPERTGLLTVETSPAA